MSAAINIDAIEPCALVPKPWQQTRVRKGWSIRPTPFGFFAGKGLGGKPINFSRWDAALVGLLSLHSTTLAALRANCAEAAIDEIDEIDEIVSTYAEYQQAVQERCRHFGTFDFDSALLSYLLGPVTRDEPIWLTTALLEGRPALVVGNDAHTWRVVLMGLNPENKLYRGQLPPLVKETR